MKSKERSWALTKEGLIHEVKKDHESSKSQKEGKKKEIIITKKEKGKKKKNAQTWSGQRTCSKDLGQARGHVAR